MTKAFAPLRGRLSRTRIQTVLEALILNVCKTDIHCILSPTMLVGSSSVAVSQAQRPQDSNTNVPIPSFVHKEHVVSVVHPDIGGESAQSGLPAHSVSGTLQLTQPEQIPVHPPFIDSPPQCLDGLSSSVLELLSTDQGVSPSCKDVEDFQFDVSQEFKPLLSIDNPCLAFYSKNLFDYEQGVAPAVVKGRLKAHFQIWVDIGVSPWVLQTIYSGYVIPLFFSH